MKDIGYILIQKDKIKLGEFDPNLIDRVMVYGDTGVIGFPPLADFELEEGNYAVMGDCDNEPFAVATAPDGTLYAYSEAPFGEDDTMIVVDNVMYAPDTMTLFEAVGPRCGK